MTSPDQGNDTGGFTSLSSTLWRLRETLDLLLFKVFEAQLVIHAGQTRWLARASRELDAAMQELHHVEVMRAVDSVALADRLRLPPDSTLRELGAAAPPPWDMILSEHRDALLSLADEVDAAADLPTANLAALDPRQAGEDIELDIVRRFLLETLSGARQTSLVTFLG